MGLGTLLHSQGRRKSARWISQALHLLGHLQAHRQIRQGNMRLYLALHLWGLQVAMGLVHQLHL